MSFEEVMGALQRMLVATDALGAVGAELSLRQSGTDGLQCSPSDIGQTR